MATKLPLVIKNGQIEQLQAGDNLDFGSESIHQEDIITAITNWSTVSSPNSESSPPIEYNWTAICWSPELGLFAICEDFNSDSDTHHATSPDGRTWTRRDETSSGTFLAGGICWSPELGLFVSCAQGSASRQVARSSDGLTWTPDGIAGTARDLNAICWSPDLGRFVGIADSTSGLTNIIIESTDGDNWAYHSISDNVKWNAICWSPEQAKFVTVGEQTASSVKIIATSTDGQTFTCADPGNTGIWNGVVWASELSLFIAVGDGTGPTGRVMTSPDGTTWTVRTTPNNDRELFGIAWSPELAVLVAVGENSICYSFDAITWVETTAPLAFTWQSICWSPELGIFCATAKCNSQGAAGSGFIFSTHRNGMMVSSYPVAWSTFSLAVQQKRLQGFDFTIPEDESSYVVDEYEINGGFELEISMGAFFEVG